MANATDPKTDGETLVLTRSFAAPRALVWKAFTERERLAQWWGPKGMKVEVGPFELKPGGKMVYSMESPQGVMWGRWIFTEVTPPERLGFIVSFSDAEGGVTRAPFFDNWPLEVQSEFVFREEGDNTVVVMTGYPINAAEDERARFVSMHDSMKGGWGGTFEQLEAYLAGAS